MKLAALACCCTLTIFEWIIVRIWESTCFSIKEFLFLYRNAKWIWNCLNTGRQRNENSHERIGTLRTFRVDSQIDRSSRKI